MITNNQHCLGETKSSKMVFNKKKKKVALVSVVYESILCVLSHFSCVWLFVTQWTVAHQVPQSRGFSRQESRSGLPYPPLENLLFLGIELTCLKSPALAGRFFTTSPTWEAQSILYFNLNYINFTECLDQFDWPHDIK